MDNITLSPSRHLLRNLTLCSTSAKSAEFSQSFAFYINGPFLLLVACTGFMGNILCLLAFSRSRRPPQINYYLIALSLWDLSLVISSFFLYNLPYLIYGRVVTEGAYVTVYPLIYVLSSISHTGSIWAVIVSAIDRYFALCHPLSHKIYSCARRTALILVIEATLAIFYNLPRYYELVLSTCYDVTTGASVPMVHASSLRANPTYWLWYKVIGGLIFFSSGPLLTLTCLSIKVWSAVRHLTRDLPVDAKTASALKQSPMGVKKRGLLVTSPLQKNGNSTSNATVIITSSKKKRILRRHSTVGTVIQESQYTLNTMLLIVIVKFVVCHSLPTALDVCEALMPPEEFNSAFISDIVAVSNFLVVCNSSISFFIYCLCSRRFRHDLAAVMPKCYYGQRSSGSDGYGTVSRHLDSQNSKASLVAKAPITMESPISRKPTLAIL